MISPPPDAAVPPADPAALEAALEELSEAVRCLTAAAEAGESVELGGLDLRVECLCAATLALTPAEGRAHVARLSGLISALDRLTGSLVRQAAAGDAGVRRRAARAYGSVAEGPATAGADEPGPGRN